MKTLATILAFAAVITSPAFAKVLHAPTQVTIGDQVIGQDPDLNVRFELKRDSAISMGGGD